MELRSCIHLHFINALKGGFTRKTLNMARGKPVLKLKNLKDICEELDAKNGVLFPTIPPKDEFRGSHLDSAKVMMGCTRNMKVKSEPEDYSGFDCDDGGDSDLECFVNMTLEQFKQICKSKKRKRSKKSSCSPVKQECRPILQANEEEDHDLLKPLSSLKIKRSTNAKKAKTKSKRMKNSTSSLSQMAIIPIKIEESSCEEDEPLQFNLDVPEPGCSDFQNTSCFDDDYSLGDHGATPTDYPMTAVECAYDNGPSFPPAIENHSCIVYEPLCKDTEDDPMPLQVISNSCWDIVEWNDTEIYSYERLDCWPEMESMIQGYITDSAHHDLYTEAISSDNTTTSTNDETRNGFSQFMEPTNKDELPSREEEASADSVSNFDLGSDSGFVAVANQISMSKEEERQSQMSASATQTTSGYLAQQHPQRLFPTRKSISPTSQEKLCKAMNSVELHDEQNMCKGQLSFGKQAETTNCGAAGQPQQIRKPKVSITPKTIRNYMNEKISSNGGDPKASIGFSTGPPRFTTGCTSIRTCTDSAVAFSQRQMHDIECITTKLTDELQIMREIAEERLPGPYASTTSLKYTTDEARMAIRNVTRVEAAAKKLLSMMSRDCNRFCKIMKMADQNGSNASEDVGNNHTETTTVVNKERKKITFADEAGEKLCHVKVFDKEMVSSLGSDPSQNQEVLVMT